MFFRSLALELIRSDVDADSIIICNFMYYFEYFENYGVIEIDIFSFSW